MKYKKTFDLVDEIISKNIDDVKIEGHEYNTVFLLPYKQKKCVDLTYYLKTDPSWITVTFNEVFLEISILRPAGRKARLVYKKENGKYIFDASLSKGYSKLAKINKDILTPELKTNEYTNTRL